MAYHFDAVDAWTVEREDPLHTDPARYFPDGKGLSHAPVLPGDNDPFKDLDPLPVPLGHLHVYLDGVARSELGSLLSQVSALYKSYP